MKFIAVLQSNISLYWKTISVALLLGLSTVATSYWIYYETDFIENYQKENQINDMWAEFDNIEWSFVSGVSLSEQLDKAIDKLLFIEVTVGITTGNGVLAPGYFEYGVVDIEAWKYSNKENPTIKDHVLGDWYLWVNGADEPYGGQYGIFSDKIHLNQSIDLNSLYDAFNTDIVLVGQFHDISLNVTNEINQGKSSSGLVYWNINHIYADGTYMNFYLFNETVIIRYMNLTSFESSEDGLRFGPSFESVNYPAYKAKVEGEVFPNYTQAVNDLLITLVEG